MRTTLSFTLLLVIGTSRALSVNPPMEVDPELTPGFFEGDIVLRSSSRNGISNSEQYWPKGIVYYKFWEGFNVTRAIFIKGVMKIVEDVSCVRFVEADDDQPYYVNVTEGTGGCFSTIGFEKGISTSNIQADTLNAGCYRPGKIIHELLHTLGFYHMQSSYDRDNYVRVAYENIVPKYVFNFKKYPKDLVKDFGIQYDYASVMHYSSNAFSANGEDTIVPLQKVQKGLLGQREGLSKIDVIKLNKMYNCSMEIKN